MKKLNLSILVVALMVLSSCSVVGGIFKAGAAIGIIAVVVVIAVIIWVISMFRGGGNKV
ncbi:MAG: phosphatidate cytidylyltransferase [Sphingobacteriaceae bacterium]|nr:MAG: phosphatidate cytidylyltransferase [Sphingobacteriaceae bacterium]